jgi:hypothetical protein
MNYAETRAKYTTEIDRKINTRGYQSLNFSRKVHASEISSVNRISPITKVFSLEHMQHNHRFIRS